MRVEYLVESTTSEVVLQPDEVVGLRRTGRRLASDRSWWGKRDDSDESAERTVIRCDPLGRDRYRVKVVDAVGVVGLGTVQLVVDPKIPLPHLVYLLERSSAIPRTSASRTYGSLEGAHFKDLLGRWLVAAAHRLVKTDLARDYNLVSGDLAAIRGRIDLAAAARQLAAGRVRLPCEFEEFGVDAPLNRVIKGALELAVRNEALPTEVARTGRRVLARMASVGPLDPNDLRVDVDRRTTRYREAHALAVAVLRSSGWVSGVATQAQTFLFRTPEPVEEGLREILRDGLSDIVDVHKTARTIEGKKKRSLNPDLVFGNRLAVGDVKYRLAPQGEMRRSDLSQLALFSAGFDTADALLVHFVDSAQAEDHALLGRVRLRALGWNCEEPDPESAGVELAESVGRWLKSSVMS